MNVCIVPPSIFASTLYRPGFAGAIAVKLSVMLSPDRDLIDEERQRRLRQRIREHQTTPCIGAYTTSVHFTSNGFPAWIGIVRLRNRK